jgi:cell division protein FtsZ
MGVGIASGEKRAEEAARGAINSPLLEVSINGAKGVLFAIAGGDDLGMLEVQDAARVITESIDSQAKVIFGAIRDDKLKKNEVKVTVIATGFPDETFANRGHISRQAPEEEADETVEEAVSRGKIFNSLPNRKAEESAPTPADNEQKASDIPKRDPKPVDASDEDDDDDWGAVPAFLRRSKLK